MIHFILYPISLLPLRILYRISDFFAFLLQYIIQYRRKVVRQNINRSFHYLPKNERRKMEKEFYMNFCDNFIETIKLLSISPEELNSHIKTDYSALEKVIENKESCHIYLGHQFNWEWANAHIASSLKQANIVVVYKPIKSKSFNNLVLKMRSRFGSKMVAAKNLKKELKEMEEKPHILIAVADQNPSLPNKSFWTAFMAQRTAFISGTELYTASLKRPVFYANISKVKRGYYKFEVTPMFNFSQDYKMGQITTSFAYNLEKAIKASPTNYLWSHKRWKHQYNDSYKNRWFPKQVVL